MNQRFCYLSKFPMIATVSNLIGFPQGVILWQNTVLDQNVVIVVTTNPVWPGLLVLGSDNIVL